MNSLGWRRCLLSNYHLFDDMRSWLPQPALVSHGSNRALFEVSRGRQPVHDSTLDSCALLTQIHRLTDRRFRQARIHTNATRVHFALTNLERILDDPESITFCRNFVGSVGGCVAVVAGISASAPLLDARVDVDRAGRIQCVPNASIDGSSLTSTVSNVPPRPTAS